MGRKRKTRWRRLSIGEISGNEDEGEEGTTGTLTRSLSSSQNHSPVHKPFSSSNNNNNSSSIMLKANTSSSLHNSSTHLDHPSPNKGESTPTNGEVSQQNVPLPNGNSPSSYGGYHQHGGYNQQSQYESHYDRYHYHKDNYRPPSSYYNGYERGGSSERGAYHGGGQKDYHYYNGYHRGGAASNGYRGGANNYNSSANGSSSNGSEGYNGGGADYHYSHHHHPPPSRGGYGPGRFRRSRSYPASNYYYGNAASNNGDNTNKPSYNQDEYTKITTPRQDVLFKKGYLSQKKPQSSVESVSSTTTPPASTNGTPDTQSTNGINSDYSEGYENGETDCVIPCDDAYYYGPPPEAVFTDPTGQVYYGHFSSNGEYYDAYPVSPMMVAGYPAMYYPVPYPIDWNGVNAPMYPMVAAPHPGSLQGPLEIEEVTENHDHDAPPLQSGPLSSTTLAGSGEVSSKSDTSTSTESTCSSSENESLPASSPTEQITPASTTSKSSTTNNTNSSSCVSEEKAKSVPVSSSSKTTPNESKASSVPKAQKSDATGDKDNNNLSQKKQVSEMSLSSKEQQKSSSSKKDSSSSTSSLSSASSNNSSAPTSPPTPTTNNVIVTYASTVAANVHPHHNHTTTQQGAAVVQMAHPQQQPPPQHYPVPRFHHHPHHGPPPPNVYHGAPPPPSQHMQHVHPSLPHPMAAMSGPPPPPPYSHMYPPIPGAGFVYGPPVYNGVASPASADTVSSSPSSTSCRKKRKKRRKEKDKDNEDEGQLTDEATSTTSTSSNPDDLLATEKSPPVIQEVDDKIKEEEEKSLESDSVKAITCMQIETKTKEDNIPITRSPSTSSSSIAEAELESQSLPLNVKCSTAEDIKESGLTSASQNSNPKPKSKKKKSKAKKSKSPASVAAVLNEMKERVVISPQSSSLKKSVPQEGTMAASRQSPTHVEASNLNKKCAQAESPNSEEAFSSNIDDGAKGESSFALASDENKIEIEMRESSEVAQMPTVCSSPSKCVEEDDLSSSSRKPTDLDLTLTSPSYEFLLKDLEPSSPSDSLNTNQSLAGSEEVAAISVSESDFLYMNRTTSLDEVEEDLPEEGENLVAEKEVSVGVLSETLFSAPKKHELLSPVEHEDAKLVGQQAAHPPSLPITLEMQKESPEKSESGEEKENVTDLGQNVEKQEKVATPQSNEAKDGVVEPQPKSLTLAVSEWLKAQGEDALLTSFSPRAKQDEEGDDADLSEDDDDDEDEDLNQNQKNLRCNPWAVTSVKDGTRSSSRVALLSKREAIKSMIHSKAINQSQEEKEEESGTCSTFPLLSSDATSTTPATCTTNKNTNYDSGYELSSPEEVHETVERRNGKNGRKSGERDIDHQPRKDESGQPIHPAAQQQAQSLTLLDNSNSPTEICDPQKFSKYYQLAVVFDPEDEEDQGIENDHAPNVTLAKEKVENLAKQSQSIIVKGYCDDGEDEEIGTFDPSAVAEHKKKRQLFYNQFDPSAVAEQQYENAVLPSNSSNHIYINPISLAKELVECSSLSGEPLSSSWDVDNSDEPLPYYEHPPPVDLPVYNHLTPQSKVIRRKFQGVVGENIPSAICCSIQ